VEGEALGVVEAFTSGNDVGGAEKSRIGEAVAEDILTDSLDDEGFGLGGFGRLGGLWVKCVRRCWTS
jgi:hypothetical protein